MKFGFHETMYGVAQNAMGNQSKFDFTVTATAPLRELVDPRGGKFMLTSLTGTVSLQMVVENHPITGGSLELDFFRDQQLKYRFSFEHEAEDVALKFRYKGEKNISLLRPVHSMTTLYGKLEVEGEQSVPYQMAAGGCPCGECPPADPEKLAEWAAQADEDGMVLMPIKSELATLSHFKLKEDGLPFLLSFFKNSGF